MPNSSRNMLQQNTCAFNWFTIVWFNKVTATCPFQNLQSLIRRLHSTIDLRKVQSSKLPRQWIHSSTKTFRPTSIDEELNDHSSDSSRLIHLEHLPHRERTRRYLRQWTVLRLETLRRVGIEWRIIGINHHYHYHNHNHRHLHILYTVLESFVVNLGHRS